MLNAKPDAVSAAPVDGPDKVLRDTLQKLAKETDAGWSPDALALLQKAVVLAKWVVPGAERAAVPAPVAPLTDERFPALGNAEAALAAAPSVGS